MIRSVELAAAVVAISDGTSRTDDAVRAAATIAQCAGSPLHTIHALDIIGQPLPEALRTLAGLKLAIEDADEALRDQLQRCAPTAPAGHRVIAHHSVTEALLRHAREQRLSIIVSAPELLRYPQVRAAEGTPAEIAELTRCPTMIVKRPLLTSSGRVLVALDSNGVDEGTVHAMIDCIISLYEAGIEARHSERVSVATPHTVPALQVELAFTALDPRECAPEERVKRHTAVWARALAERGEAPPLWSIAWSERPGRHLRRRAADPDLDLLVLHRSQVDALSHYEVLDSVLASAIEVASCPVLAHPTRVRTPLRPAGIAGDEPSGPAHVSSPELAIAG